MDKTFQDDEGSGLIYKKFWSYGKATGRNIRIPELVFLDDTFKSNPNCLTLTFISNSLRPVIMISMLIAPTMKSLK